MSYAYASGTHAHAHAAHLWPKPVNKRPHDECLVVEAWHVQQEEREPSRKHHMAPEEQRTEQRKPARINGCRMNSAPMCKHGSVVTRSGWGRLVLDHDGCIDECCFRLCFCLVLFIDEFLPLFGVALKWLQIRGVERPRRSDEIPELL